MYIVPAKRKGEGRIKDEQVNHAYSRVKHCLAFMRFLFHLHTQIDFFRFFGSAWVCLGREKAVVYQAHLLPCIYAVHPPHALALAVAEACLSCQLGQC